MKDVESALRQQMSQLRGENTRLLTDDDVKDLKDTFGTL